MTKRPSIDPKCPSMEAALELLGRPWTGMLLAGLQDGPLRYSELSVRMQGIGDKILTARLRELEQKGLVMRQVDAGPPIKVTYGLTGLGSEFREVVSAIDTWGRKLVAQRAPRPSRPRR